MPNLKVYQATPRGFDGGTDKTDMLILWIASPNRQLVDEYLKGRDIVTVEVIQVNPLDSAVDVTLEAKLAPKYNHAYTLAFSLNSEDKTGEVTG